jgi:hypothetical protein
VPFQLVMSKSSPSSRPYEQASVTLSVHMFRAAGQWVVYVYQLPSPSRPSPALPAGGSYAVPLHSWLWLMLRCSLERSRNAGAVIQQANKQQTFLKADGGAMSHAWHPCGSTEAATEFQASRNRLARGMNFFPRTNVVAAKSFSCPPSPNLLAAERRRRCITA